MPRNKKNKGNSGSTPAPNNNNKAKSPAVAPVPVPVTIEADTSNDDLKLRLANAKERLHLLQEVIGGIGDPTDVDNLKAGGIDAAKEKLNIIQDSVDSVKTTLLQVRQETSRSVTPEGSQGGTNKKRKNKKHQNQNPPQGFVAREQPASEENKSKTDASENEGSAQEDGTSTLSKKKRNRNRNKNKKVQQEQSSASESLPQGSDLGDKAESTKIDEQQSVKVTAPQSEQKTQTKENTPQGKPKPEPKEITSQAPAKVESKENSPEASKLKNNKKNKKNQQKSSDEKIEAEVKPTDLNKTPIVEDKPILQPPSNDKNKNRKNKNKNAEGNNSVQEKGNEPSKDQEVKSKIQGESKSTTENQQKTDNTATDVFKDMQASNLKKDDSLSQKENPKKSENIRANVKDQQPKEIQNDPKKMSTESILPKEIPKTSGEAENIKAIAESPKLDSPKNKKDKRKGQNVENKPVAAKVEEKLSEIKGSESSGTLTAPKDEAKTVDANVPKIDVSKVENDKNRSQEAKSEDKNESTISLSSSTQIQEKKDSNQQSQQQQSSKNKKGKQHVPKTEQVTAEKTCNIAPDNTTVEKSVAPLSKEPNQVLDKDTVIEKEDLDKIEAGAPILKSSEKVVEKVLEVVAGPAVQTEVVTDNKKGILKTNESPIPVATDNLTSKTEIITATPSLPKLDFSQVVKDNKDKIPLMEIKTVPVLPAEGLVEYKPSADAGKITEDVKTPTPAATSTSTPELNATLIEVVSKPTSDVAFTPTQVAANKTTDEILSANIIEAKVNMPVSTECEAGSNPKQNKTKTPERKGNQGNVKNEPKKPQQGKGQSLKEKQNDPKPQANKKEEAKHTEVAKVDTETKVVIEKLVPEKSLPGNVVTEKVETKLDSPPVKHQIEEKKSKEDVSKKPENIKKEQVKPVPLNDPKDKEAEKKKVDTSEKQLPTSKDNTNKKSVSPPVVDANAAEHQKKYSKPESSSSQPQKQEHKTEMSKKDQKKQNKLKGKAPQPPDIPMDMSLLSASMIDPASDEAISHEESEDQSSLITSDSKNVAGSDFVQSVDSLKATSDATKSLELIQTTPTNENKHSDVERETKSSSPSSSKRNKDLANLKESVEMQETKRQELPEKSAQQKMEPVQFPPVKLMDILEAKMTNPSVKPGNVAGNVRKLPKDTKRTDQLNVQQQKSRSKSPKENIAEKYVKNQQLASGDNKKQGTQNLKEEILKSEVGALVTSVSKEKEVKEPTKIDANLTDPKVTSGTASTPTAVTKVEQVGNLKESDAVGKQKAEPLPKNNTIPAVIGEKNEAVGKPKIAPKPNVPLKTATPVADRSKKSPVKTPENKTPAKVSSTKETVVPSKAQVQTKSSPQSKSTAKPSTTTSKSEQSTKKPEVPPKPNLGKATPNKVPQTQTPIQDDDEEFVEYKFSPRPVFIATACQICKVPLDVPNPCKQCQMVSYCSDEHEKEDQASHIPLCTAIQEIAKKRGGHIYNNARILNDDDYRNLSVHTLNLCENFLKRHLMPFEREMLLFPRLCCTGSCREWRQQSLIECKQCGQVSYCAAHPEHLSPHHELWCNSFNLYQKIVLRQKFFGRIEPCLPSKIMLKPFDLSDNIDNIFKILYKNYGSIKDECIYATLTQLATAPLTALYGAQKNQQEIGEIYTIHLVGAELQFEADTLDKWETFFLHLVPTLVECRVVFVGPELNAENLPLEILSRIRMCRTCRQNCRIVKFDFQCGILYHDYVNSSAFTKPDLICFFNPGLYRTTGFNGLDRWPNTIKSATSMNCPIVVTSYTEIESKRDLDRIQKESDRPLSVVQPPQINPFASQRPERNFISDEVAPMIFKNFFCFCVK